MANIGDYYDFVDKAFRGLVIGTAELEVLYDKCRWAEGPVWFGDGGYLIWSDIPNNRQLRWIPDFGVGVYRAPSNYTNGNTRDREGRLISCSHGARAVLRTELDGTVTVLADRYKGGRLNSPNDVVVKSDGSVWFTDPDYGILHDYEGHKSPSEQQGCSVFRLDADSGELTVVADDFVKPNGLAFSPDESLLYVAESGSSHDEGAPRHIRVFDVKSDGTLTNSRVFAEMETGFPDGFRLDTDGRIWTSAGHNVECYLPDGTLIGRIKLDNPVSNVAFGGPKRNRLFITCTNKLYSLYVTATGAQRP
jgi:gluconolactonase